MMSEKRFISEQEKVTRPEAIAMAIQNVPKLETDKLLKNLKEEEDEQIARAIIKELQKRLKDKSAEIKRIKGEFQEYLEKGKKEGAKEEILNALLDVRDEEVRIFKKK